MNKMEILSLNSYSKYNELVSYFEENKDKPIEEWLEFDKILDKPGKQGVVGLFRPKNDTLKEKFIFKISQYINYLVYHELIIMQGLKEVSTYCPHFCKGIGLVKCNLDAKFDKEASNPFEIKSKYPVEKEILLCEYIDKSCKFYNYIRNKSVDENILYSIVKQVLLAIAIAQKETKFTHYDLHSFNVMIKKCDKDLVFLYKLDDENQFCVPTLGYYPVIIDFGFSYIEDLNDGPLFPSLAHTNVGFLSDRFDWVADPKLFLVSVSDEIKDKRKTKKAKKFRRVVKNIFHPLSIDFECGWDETEDDKGATDYVLDMLEKVNKSSSLFSEYDYYCIDILQTLVIIPLEKQNTDDFETSYQVFMKEWIKIENEISNPFYNIYILKKLVDSARFLRPRYYRKKSRDDAIRVFKKNVFDAVSSVSKYCMLKTVHFERMLCSLLIFARCLEGVLYKIMTERVKEKNKEYSKLPLKSVEEIFAVINTNIPDEYEYNEKTQVLVIDNVKKDCKLIKKLPDELLENINEITNLSKGCYINDFLEL